MSNSSDTWLTTNLYSKGFDPYRRYQRRAVVAVGRGHCFRDQSCFCQMEKVKVRQAAYRLGSLETFMRMVESGNGITFIPELATLQLSKEQKELVHVRSPFPSRHGDRLVTRKDFIRHTVARVF